MKVSPVSVPLTPIPSILKKGIAFSRSCHYAHDLIIAGVPPGPAEDIITEPFTIEDGSVKIPDGPGLGVQLDEGKMAKAEKRYIEYLEKTGSDTCSPVIWQPDRRFSFDPPRGPDRRGGVPDNWD